MREFFDSIIRDLGNLASHGGMDPHLHWDCGCGKGPQVGEVVSIVMVNGSPYIYSEELTNEEVAAVLQKALNDLPVPA